MDCIALGRRGLVSTTEEHAAFVTVGATNHSAADRENNDYYATDPLAIELLLDKEQFSNNIWECACGEGHLSRVLEQRGYHVDSTDLIDRGYGSGGVDFLSSDIKYDGDIITNPPYRYAKEFVEHAIESITDGHRVAMFLRLQFLEGKARRELFDKYPPRYVYVSSSRINCCKNGDFSKEQKKNTGALAHAWFIWEKPYSGETVVRWFN